MSKAVELANRNGLMGLSGKAKISSKIACISYILVLLWAVILLSLCMAGYAFDYYSGQKYSFSTTYNANWEYYWDASCCSDPTKPCCYDPTKTHESTFTITAPIVDKPTEFTVSVVARDKTLPTCMDTAQLKIIVKPLAGVAMVKKHLGGEGTFPFEGTGFTESGGISSFSLNPSNSYTIAWPRLNPGTYTITELVPAGWDLDNIEVTGTDISNYHINGNSITITRQSGESPIITFTDKKRCSLTITKSAVGRDDEFSFTGTGFTSGSPLESFKLMNGQTAFEQSLIPGKAYTITEAALAGWGLDSIKVTGTNEANYQITGNSITITPQPGESPIVTFKNGKRGSITVDKVTSPPGSVTEFEFKPSYGNPFKLSDTSEPLSSGSLIPGTYSISEIAVEGWDLQDITITGIASIPTIDKSNGIISFNLAAGETALVTYTNRKHQGDISGCLWDDANNNGVIDEGEQKLVGWTVRLLDALGNVVATCITDENGYYEFNNIASGIYTIDVTPQTGWSHTYPSSGKVEISYSDTPIVQNFGYRSLGSITVIKDGIPDSSQSFSFTGTLGKFALIDDGTSSNRAVFENLDPGDYQIVEQIPSGWSLTSIKCMGASSDYTTNGVIVHLGYEDNAIIKFEDTANQGGLKLKKTALNTSVKMGEDIIYTINLCNDGSIPLTNVTLWDILPDSVELVYVSPEPVSYYLWHIGTLDPGQCFAVDLRVRVKRTDINYDMAQKVQGKGFVNVHNNYDTSLGPESVKNCAYAKADLTDTVSSCAYTRIENPGTELIRRESGSGIYSNEDLTRIRTENKSIKTITSLSATYIPTTFSLPGGSSIGYGSKWTEKSKSKNRATGTTVTEEYTSASRIENERFVELDEDGSTTKSDVEFEGIGHIGVLKIDDLKKTPKDLAEIKSVYESQEDYVGSFKIYEYIDDYGTSVVFNRSTSGFGYVAVDKRVRNIQGSYESGTGYYKSEELIDTPTSHMAKNISLIHAPVSYIYSPDFKADQSIKWTEGMWSKSGNLKGGNDIANCENYRQLIPSSCLANGTRSGTLISERYSYLNSLKKETIASGLNEMKARASSSGQADYKVTYNGENGTSRIDSEERYVGNYDITRHVLLTGVSRYDMPHLTVTKEGTTKSEFYNGTDATLAEYTIRITNDGSRALAPVYVRDFFPPGTQYIRSTIRPDRIDSSSADWTLLHLGIGDTVNIGLTLNVTEVAQGNLVNRVQACGSYNGNSICAGNYSVQEFNWLTCCPPKVQLSKRGWQDNADPTLVHYRIVIVNKAINGMAVTATDQLPGDMILLGASITPNIDSAGRMIWILTEIRPGESETIDYTTRALRDGGYTNTVHIDAIAINGDSSDTAEAAAYVEVNSTGVAPKTSRYGGWQPPAWNLSSKETTMTIEPELGLEAISPEGYGTV